MSSVPRSSAGSRSSPVSRRVLTRAREGNGGVALIVGEAGVGKSRLLRAMMDEAREPRLLHHARRRASRPNASIPYAPLLDLVRLFAGARRPRSWRTSSRRPPPSSSRSSPSCGPLLPDATPSPATDPDADKRRLFHALARTITCSRARSRCSSRSRTCTGATTRRSISSSTSRGATATQPVRHRADVPRRGGGAAARAADRGARARARSSPSCP